MAEHPQFNHALLTYLRHELCTPINGMIGYSELLLEALQTQPETALFQDLQKIQICSQQLLTLVTAMLDPAQLEISPIDGDLSQFGSTLRMELLTPLSTIIGYSEMLLEEAPADLGSDLKKLYASAQQLSSLINDIVSLAQQQLEAASPEVNSAFQPVLESQTAASLVQSAVTVIQSLSQESPEKPAQSGIILVIDDNPTNCDLLARQLKRQAHRVTTATSAQQAIDLLKATPYDLILLDVIMPGMNGLELLRQLKRHPIWRHIPVIMISALNEIDGAVKCIELGAEDYLHKPFNPVLLKARIGAYLERKQLRDQELLYLQQVERLKAAAAAVEAKTFQPETLDDLVQYPNHLGQLARVFQRMAHEVHSREQQLKHQLDLLQISIDSGQKQRLVAEIAATDHFRQLQKRTKGSSDIENLYCASLYPSLSQYPAKNIEKAKSQESHAPAKPPTLLRAVQRLTYFPTDAHTNDAALAKIIAIHSFRGGTGKSNLTSNLAMSLAKQGKRVGIIDTDLQSPGIHTLFGLEDEAIGYTLNDYLWGRSALYEAAHDLSDILQQPADSAGSLYLIPASTKATDITRILREGYHQERLLDGFSDLSRDLQLDFLLIDTHPGINEETLQAIAICSLLVVLLRPDYQDYQGTAVIVELARMLSVAKILLVVNKALPSFDVEPYRQQLEAAYDISVAEILPFSEELMHLASSEIFSVRYPDHPLAKAVDHMSQQILEQILEPRVTSCPH